MRSLIVGRVEFNMRQRTLILRWLLPALLLTAAAALAVAITSSATIVALDATLGRLARGLTAGMPLQLGFELSALGATDVALPLTAAAAGVLCAIRHWRGALALVVAVAATQGVVQLIKDAISRPRPGANEAMADASGFSFPSAHSATSMALYATLAFLAARASGTRARVGIVVGAGMVVVAVGLSRVLLAAHYPTDVLAGWLTGAALAAAAWLAVRRLPLPAPLARRAAG